MLRCSPDRFGAGQLLLLASLLGALPLGAQTGERDPVLAALEQYVGDWRAEDRQSPDGRAFHFLYSLRWFDAGRTMVEMVIHQRFHDGENRLLWRGFKAKHPTRGIVEYNAVSPGGRMAQGHVEVEGTSVVTVYRGWGPAGGEVRIRDVFSPVDDDSFTSTTHLRRAEGTEWQVANVDRWERIVPADQAPSDCTTATHQQLDFLLGAWEIRNQDGTLVGTNVVSREMGGCTIRERYRGVDGTVGESFNTYDTDQAVWRQAWVDNQGRGLQLHGVVSGERGLELAHADNRERFRWVPLSADSILQTKERKQSAESSWDPTFTASWVRLPDRSRRTAPTALPERMTPLAGMLGTWVVTPIQQDSAGVWTEGPSLPVEFRSDLRGHAIVADPTSLLGAGWVSSIETFSWDPFRGLYRLTWHDSLSGLMDVYEGHIDGDVLHLDNLNSKTFWTTPDGSEFAFRLEYDLEEEGGVREGRVFSSSDGGSTWDLYQRTEYRRVGH